MYYRKEVERIIKWFYIAMIIILIVGIVGGIGAGLLMRQEDWHYGEGLNKVYYEAWTINSTIYMLGIWAGSGLAILLLYAKMLHLKMMNEILRHLPHTNSEDSQKQCLTDRIKSFFDSLTY